MSAFSSPYNFFAALFAMLGDSGFLGLLCLLSIIYFLVIRFARGALALLLAYLGCGALMALLKIFFMACHQSFPSFDLHSPSGHAAMSAAVYGTFASLIVTNCKGWRGPAAVALAFVLSVSVAFSRVYFGHHSYDEIGLGLVIGSAVALCAFAFLRKREAFVFHVRYLALLSFVPVAIFFGSFTHLEGVLSHISRWLNAGFSFCS